MPSLTVEALSALVERVLASNGFSDENARVLVGTVGGRPCDGGSLYFAARRLPSELRGVARWITYRRLECARSQAD